MAAITIPTHLFIDMSRGGVKAGSSYGESHELNLYAERSNVHVPNLLATILHLLRLDHSG